MPSEPSLEDEPRVRRAPTPRRVRGVAVGPRQAIEIDRLAAIARARLAPSTPITGAVDLPEVLSTLDGRILAVPDGTETRMRFGVVSLPARTLARTVYSRRDARLVIELDIRTYDDLRQHDDRARFAVAHEIGHATLHLAELVSGTSLHGPALPLPPSHHPAYRDSAWQANRFAAAFLAPDDGLRRLATRGPLGVPVVTDTFGMPATAARARIDNFRTVERAGASPAPDGLAARWRRRR